MDFQKNITLGRVLWVSKDVIYKSIGRNLYYSNDMGVNWKLRARLPMTDLRSVSLFSNILSRLLRSGFYHLHVLDNKSLLVFANRSIYLLKQDSTSFKYVGPIRSSKPLLISVHEDVIVYGEYTRNVERTAVPLYKSDDAGVSWFIAHTFKDIRHIHGVFFDRFSDKYFITTGDSDEESSILMTDKDFLKFEKLLTGSQKYRAVQLLFDPNFIYYGSDAPDTANYLYRLSRNSGQLECLSEVGAPVFFGAKVLDYYFFATAIEKSSYKNINVANLWHSKNGLDWKCAFSLRRSFLPLRIFQNGQILFPSGHGDDENLWFWSLATSGDNQSYRVRLNQFD